MRGLSSVKMISYFSLVFIILETLLSFGPGIKYSGIIFLWAIIVNIGVLNINKKKLKYIACSVLLVAPILFLRQFNEFAFVILIIATSLLFIYKNMHRLKYGDFLDEFNNGLLILVVILIISVLSFNFTKVAMAIAPFIIIYFVSSIILLRSLRILEYTKDNKYVHKLNLKYSALVITISFILSIETIRNAFKIGIGLIYEGISALILLLATLLFMTVGTIMEKIISFIFSLLKHSKVKLNADSGEKALKFKKKDLNSDYLLNNPVFEKWLHIILWVTIIILVFYITYRIFKKTNKKDKGLEFYEEEKETIIKTKTNDKSLLRRLTNIFKAKNNNEFIRFYYIKYLKLCLKNKINILESDTSLEINDKAKNSFSSDNINILRDIYIKSRYSGEEIDDKSLSRFLECFKKIKN
jgi:lysylphosphatidylglycerol synthetase-like protein (DUF2156 family)